uniref:Uncharacterized protein n=1 Tax=Bracon brevicornis TaxID=1563983 RepID=A0A6V7KQT9_9HYME
MSTPHPISLSSKTSRGNTPGPASGNVPTSSSSPELRSPPLVITLCSYSLVREVIQAKLKHRKLHTSELDVALVHEAGLMSPLPAALININGMLPPELYKLRRLAIEECKRLKYTTFIRDGGVYVKKRKEDNPTKISCITELKNFCEGSL